MATGRRKKIRESNHVSWFSSFFSFLFFSFSHSNFPTLYHHTFFTCFFFFSSCIFVSSFSSPFPFFYRQLLFFVQHFFLLSWHFIISVSYSLLKRSCLLQSIIKWNLRNDKLHSISCIILLLAYFNCKPDSTWVNFELQFYSFQDFPLLIQLINSQVLQHNIS